MVDYKKYAICPPAKKEDFRLINQEAVKRCSIPESESHNAIWDFHISKDGTVYFPLCAELHYCENAWLYRYNYQTNDVTRLFKLEEKIFCHDDNIRASKIHTSLSDLPDGRLIMSTHTTAQSPRHPAWLPEAYYAHPWEGYEGSNILIYDPKTGAVENRGKPVPYESIYGGKYSPIGNAFYFTGLFRGHLYRLDLDTNYVHDYGQITEFGSFRVALGPDGNIYCNSRSGIFYRVNTRTKELEDTGLRFPKNVTIPQGNNHSQFDYYANLGKKMYIAVVFNVDTKFIVFDTEKNTFELTDSYLPKNTLTGPVCTTHGMAFDSNNVLWYTLRRLDPTLQGCGQVLCSWDITRGGKPIEYGLVGTNERAALDCAEIEIYDDILYSPDSNYLFDYSAIIAIDLKKLQTLKEKGPYAGDPCVYSFVKNSDELYNGDLSKDLQAYENYMNEMDEYGKLLSKNNFSFPGEPSVVRIWRQCPIEESAVQSVRFDGDTVKAICGKDGCFREMTIEKDHVTDVKKVKFATPEKIIPDFLKGLDYPSIPGRQYKAEPDVFAKIWDGKYIVATKDGIVCIVDGVDVYSVGTAIQTCSPVVEFAVSKKRHIVYGIAGGPHDCGIIFSYDDKRGLRQIGRTFFNQFRKPGVVSSNEFSSIDISPDENTIVIGAKDRLGCVWMFDVSKK